MRFNNFNSWLSEQIQQHIYSPEPVSHASLHQRSGHFLPNMANIQMFVICTAVHGVFLLCIVEE